MPSIRWLRAIFPLADQKQEVRVHYKGLFNELHQYAHPSAYLTARMLGDSTLHVKDGFDKQWARVTVDIGAKVFDLIWLAVLAHHPEAFERVVRLIGKYPVLLIVFEHENAVE